MVDLPSSRISLALWKSESNPSPSDPIGLLFGIPSDRMTNTFEKTEGRSPQPDPFSNNDCPKK